MAANYTFSAPVSVEKAKTVAFNFIKKSDSRIQSSDMALVYTSTNANNNNLFYVFGHANGFVLIAADDRIQPVIGYSNEGRPFLLPKAGDTITGNNFWGLMKTYNQIINKVITENLSGTEDITTQWSHLLGSGTYSPKSPTTVVAPLLTTTWGQGWPYNSMCPTDPSGPGGHVWVGCVGTAMAQIMKHHSYPAVGLGSFGYQWGSYPPTFTNFNTSYNWSTMPNSTSVVNNDISKAMFHSANSVMSMWGAGSTGVMYSSDEDPMTRAFVNYFKFAYSSIQFIGKINYTATQWDNLIQAELLANRPVYYRGDGVGSHAWVCDGLDASNLYHFNFGWDGNYNGYYSLGDITPGSYDFTNNQMAIIGIKPNDGSTLTTHTTWSGTMNIMTNICVPDSITLTITPGAVIKFAQGCKLQVFGRILSNGISSSYAKLTAIDITNGWEGIGWDNLYMNQLVMADNDTSRLNYTQIEYSQSSGIYCMAYGKLVINHCKINNNNSDYGAGLNIQIHPISISHTEIYNNHATIEGGVFL